MKNLKILYNYIILIKLFNPVVIVIKLMKFYGWNNLFNLINNSKLKYLKKYV